MNDSADLYLFILRQALQIANRAVVADIQSGCVLVYGFAAESRSNPRWWDTRPMLDPNEHAGDSIDMAGEALAYAEAAALIKRHPQQRYMITLTQAGEAAATANGHAS